MAAPKAREFPLTNGPRRKGRGSRQPPATGRKKEEEVAEGEGEGDGAGTMATWRRGEKAPGMRRCWESRCSVCNVEGRIGLHEEKNAHEACTFEWDSS